jgi:hypothetical protein
MDRKEQHHQKQQKEREHEKKEHKKQEQQQGKNPVPLHPAWLIAVGIALILVAVPI